MRNFCLIIGLLISGLALAAARVAEENRGRDIVILDMRELTHFPEPR